MAGPNSETSALWQVQASAVDGAQATAGNDNTIWFNPSPIILNGNFMSEFDVDFRRASPENEAVDADNNELQDMGIDGLDIQIGATIRNADNDATSSAINKGVTFLKDGNTATGYTKGRYGLTLANLPQFNVTPTSTYGYHIRSIRFSKNTDVKDAINMIINLSLGGDIANAI